MFMLCRNKFEFFEVKRLFILDPVFLLKMVWLNLILFLLSPSASFEAFAATNVVDEELTRRHFAPKWPLNDQQVNDEKTQGESYWE